MEKNYIEIWSVAARKLFDLSDNWMVYSLEFLDKDDGYLEPVVKIGMAITEGVYSKGPRKGQAKYSKTQRRMLSCTSAIFDKAVKEHSILEKGTCSPGQILQEIINKEETPMRNILQWFTELSNEEFEDLLNGKIEIDESLAEDLAEATNKTKEFWLETEKNYRDSLRK